MRDLPKVKSSNYAAVSGINFPSKVGSGKQLQHLKTVEIPDICIEMDLLVGLVRRCNAVAAISSRKKNVWVIQN